MKIYHSKRPYTLVHLTRACPGAKRAYELVTSSIDQIGSRDLCSHCFPQWPRVRVMHRKCQTCKADRIKPHPCRHNGGVAVMIPTPQGYRRGYVWPEHAYRYRLAPPEIQV